MEMGTMHQFKIGIFLFVYFVGGALGFFNNLASSMIAGPKSIPGIQSIFSSEPTSDVMITMDTPMSPIIQQFSHMSFPNRDVQVTSMATAMQSAALASQAPVLAALQGFNVQTESYWLTNQLFVKSATPSLIQAISGLPEVKSIMEDKKFPLIPIFNQTTGQAPNGTLWNIRKVKAHLLWKQGIKGKGVVVASIDTGVRASHTTIKDNYVGTENFGWYDPIMGTREPADIQGHGTHTVGTMVGRMGIGAAPRAKWMACKGCGVQSCMQHALVACGQWALCPSDPQSKKLNCTNIPHIVNNSWGGPGGQTWYEDIIKAWAAVGIIPFFANGNSGPQCETAGSPGDSEVVIAIGATEKDDKLAKFSSRGPKVIQEEQQQGGVFGGFSGMMGKKKTATDCIKPDISAPGHQINSAGIYTDNAYKVQSGTSMASPLAAGAAALLLSKNPKLTLDELKYLLYSTADQKLPPSGTQQCGNVVETEFPNNMYGHGRINIYKAYKKMVQMMKEKEEEEKKQKDDDEDEDEKDEEEDDENEDTSSKSKKKKKSKKDSDESGSDEETE